MFGRFFNFGFFNMLSLIKTVRVCLKSASCLLVKRTVIRVIISNLTGSLDLL